MNIHQAEGLGRANCKITDTSAPSGFVTRSRATLGAWPNLEKQHNHSRPYSAVAAWPPEDERMTSDDKGEAKAEAEAEAEAKGEAKAEAEAEAEAEAKTKTKDH